MSTPKPPNPATPGTPAEIQDIALDGVAADNQQIADQQRALRNEAAASSNLATRTALDRTKDRILDEVLRGEDRHVADLATYSGRGYISRKTLITAAYNVWIKSQSGQPYGAEQTWFNNLNPHPQHDSHGRPILNEPQQEFHRLQLSFTKIATTPERRALLHGIIHDISLTSDDNIRQALEGFAGNGYAHQEYESRDHDHYSLLPGGIIPLGDNYSQHILSHDNQPTSAAASFAALPVTHGTDIAASDLPPGIPADRLAWYRATGIKQETLHVFQNTFTQQIAAAYGGKPDWAQTSRILANYAGTDSRPLNAADQAMAAKLTPLFEAALQNNQKSTDHRDDPARYQLVEAAMFAAVNKNNPRNPLHVPWAQLTAIPPEFLATLRSAAPHGGTQLAASGGGHSGAQHGSGAGGGVHHGGGQGGLALASFHQGDHRVGTVIGDERHFDVGKYTLSADDKKALDTMIAQFKTALEGNPQAHLQIVGHTDSSGGDRINVPLSQHRAQAVAEYLQQNGIAADRMVTVGAGSSAPRENTQATDPSNRRVSFSVVKPDSPMFQPAVNAGAPGTAPASPVPPEGRAIPVSTPPQPAAPAAPAIQPVAAPPAPSAPALTNANNDGGVRPQLISAVDARAVPGDAKRLDGKKSITSLKIEASLAPAAPAQSAPPAAAPTTKPATIPVVNQQQGEVRNPLHRRPGPSIA